MNTNYYDNDAERMMREEYGGDPGGCLWAVVAYLLVFAALCCVILFETSTP